MKERRKNYNGVTHNTTLSFTHMNLFSNLSYIKKKKNYIRRKTKKSKLNTRNKN